MTSLLIPETTEKNIFYIVNAQNLAQMFFSVGKNLKTIRHDSFDGFVTTASISHIFYEYVLVYS